MKSRAALSSMALTAMALTAALVVGTALPAGAVDISPQIVNGREPVSGEASSLVYFYADGWSCGGTLVAPTIVITAAHCTDGKRVANMRIGHSATNVKPQATIPVSEAITHPDYDPQTFENDISILILSAPVTGVAPTAVPSERESARLLAAGASVRSAGYGVTSSSSSITSPFALAADMLVMPDSACASRKRFYTIGGIDFYGFNSVNVASAVCAIGVVPGTDLIIDTCQGDSGGPLYGGSGSATRLVGLVSVGVGCAGFDGNQELTRKRPGIYTRIAAFLPWLAANGVPMSPDPTLAAPSITATAVTNVALTATAEAGSATQVDYFRFTATGPSGPAGSCEASAQANAGTCTIGGLSPNTTYSLTAVAGTADGDVVSDPSNPVSVRTADKPGVPSFVTKARTINTDGTVTFVVHAGVPHRSPLLWTRVRCVSSAGAVAHDVVAGRATLSLATGIRQSCRVISANDYGSTASQPWVFKLPIAKSPA